MVFIISRLKKNESPWIKVHFQKKAELGFESGSSVFKLMLLIRLSTACLYWFSSWSQDLALWSDMGKTFRHASLLGWVLEPGFPWWGWVSWNPGALRSFGAVSNYWMFIFEVMLLINTLSLWEGTELFPLAPRSLRKVNNYMWFPTLLTKFCIVKAMVFSVVMHARESWTITLSIDELMLLNCGAREDSWESLGLQGDQSNLQSILKKINPEYSLRGPDVKNRLIWEVLDSGKDWRQEEKGTAEDERIGWHHWLNGHGFEQTPGDGEGQGGLACCRPWGRRVRHDWVTEQQPDFEQNELLWFFFYQWCLCLCTSYRMTLCVCVWGGSYS